METIGADSKVYISLGVGLYHLIQAIILAVLYPKIHTKETEKATGKTISSRRVYGVGIGLMMSSGFYCIFIGIERFLSQIDIFAPGVTIMPFCAAIPGCAFFAALVSEIGNPKVNMIKYYNDNLKDLQSASSQSSPFIKFFSIYMIHTLRFKHLRMNRKREPNLFQLYLDLIVWVCVFFFLVFLGLGIFLELGVQFSMYPNWFTILIHVYSHPLGIFKFPWLLCAFSSGIFCGVFLIKHRKSFWQSSYYKLVFVFCVFLLLGTSTQIIIKNQIISVLATLLFSFTIYIVIIQDLLSLRQSIAAILEDTLRKGLLDSFMHRIGNMQCKVRENIWYVHQRFREGKLEEEDIDKAVTMAKELSGQIDVYKGAIGIDMIHPSSFSYINLEDVIREFRSAYFMSLTESKYIDLVTNIDQNVPQVRSSKELLKDVLTNLVDNAVDAIEIMKNQNPSFKGKIVIDLALHTKGNIILLTVSNNGVPISPDDQMRIFNLFHTTKPRGNGIGLNRVKEVVEGVFGGKIELIESTPVRTAFQVTLPVT